MVKEESKESHREKDIKSQKIKIKTQ